MTPRDAYIRMTPRARRLVDRGYGWMLPPAYVVTLPLMLAFVLLVLCRRAASELCAEAAELPHSISEGFLVVRLGSRYRRNAEPGDPNG